MDKRRVWIAGSLALTILVGVVLLVRLSPGEAAVTPAPLEQVVSNPLPTPSIQVIPIPTPGAEEAPWAARCGSVIYTSLPAKCLSVTGELIPVNPSPIFAIQPAPNR